MTYPLIKLTIPGYLRNYRFDYLIRELMDTCFGFTDYQFEPTRDIIVTAEAYGHFVVCVRAIYNTCTEASCDWLLEAECTTEYPDTEHLDHVHKHSVIVEEDFPFYTGDLILITVPCKYWNTGKGETKQNDQRVMDAVTDILNERPGNTDRVHHWINNRDKTLVLTVAEHVALIKELFHLLYKGNQADLEWLTEPEIATGWGV